MRNGRINPNSPSEIIGTTENIGSNMADIQNAIALIQYVGKTTPKDASLLLGIEECIEKALEYVEKMDLSDIDYDECEYEALANEMNNQNA